MKSLLFAIVFALLLSSPAFAIDRSLEFDIGYSSPNKGLAGIRFWPEPNWSFGFIWGSFSFYNDYSDFGIAGSHHFYGYTGPYVFQSHHWLNSKVGNIWEISTGGGYQQLLGKNFLVYTELGIPLYIGGGKIWRYYKGGVPRNKDVLFSFRAGFGVGYMLHLF
ncbi:MAG: hypothetical protein LBC85_03365 [Fibromonadaceae bacterium]|jgi:opacity protein-like surface antigen|nr:hypothetical protein [Fibromonadaceae bacterium]